VAAVATDIDTWDDLHSDPCHAAEHEHRTDLIDIRFRRVGAGWTGTMDWDEARVDAEVAKHEAYIAHMHRVGPDGLHGGDRRMPGGE
jgi:hypothetical protein